MKRVALLLLAWALGCAAPAFADPVGAVAPGTAGTQSMLMGCYYPAATPAPATGQQMAVSCDANGNLVVSSSGGGGSSQIQGNTAAAGADTGNPVKTGGVFNTAPPTYTTGQRTDTQSDSRGNTNIDVCGNGTANCAVVAQVSLDAAATSNSLSTRANSYGFNSASWDRLRTATGLDGTGLGVQAIEQGGRSANNITTATTTTVKSGSGTLDKVCVNTAVASATITIYANTAASGTKIGTITLPSTITGVTPFCQPYGVWFQTGLTVVTSGATDLTVVYR